jgi:hypothetical protein
MRIATGTLPQRSDIASSTAQSRSYHAKTVSMANSEASNCRVSYSDSISFSIAIISRYLAETITVAGYDFDRSHAKQM